MQVHSNATTNKKQRALIQNSMITTAALSRQFHISKKTVDKWRRRNHLQDLSSRPRRVSYALDEATARLVRHCRQHSLSLDAIWRGLKPYLRIVNRTNTYRTLLRAGLNRLPNDQPKTKQFKNYEPGFVHLDWFYLPKLEPKKRYCIVAIDRATRWLEVGFYEAMSKENAIDFMLSLIENLPFSIYIVLTDNGACFTNTWYSKQRGGAKEHSDFSAYCAYLAIEHRLTKIKHPWTNGMVENANKQIKANTIKKQHYPSYEAAEKGIRAYVYYHNLKKPLRALGWKTPFETTLAWYKKEPTIFIKDPHP